MICSMLASLPFHFPVIQLIKTGGNLIRHQSEYGSLCAFAIRLLN